MGADSDMLNIYSSGGLSLESGFGLELKFGFDGGGVVVFVIVVVGLAWARTVLKLSGRVHSLTPS